MAWNSSAANAIWTGSGLVQDSLGWHGGVKIEADLTYEISYIMINYTR